MSTELKITESQIKGLFVIDLVLHEDERGWFKENYHKEKFESLGLPTFNIVQNNYSFNNSVGVTRGLHAEPWEKYITVTNGKVFCAWVDLRKPDFSKTFSIEITPNIAVFVPRGVANGYQTLEENVTYTYLVNSYWSADKKYSAVNLYDPDIGINWPIKQSEAIISEKDSSNSLLKNTLPMEF